MMAIINSLKAKLGIPMVIYSWKKEHIDGKVDENILGAAHPGCCKQ